MGPKGPKTRQVQEFFDSVYATKLLNNTYHSEAFSRRRKRLRRCSKQFHSQLHDITRADLCNIFLISRQIPLTKFLLPSYTVWHRDSKDFSCFSSISTHRSQNSTNNTLWSYEKTSYRLTSDCCIHSLQLQYRRYTKSCRKLIFLSQFAQFTVAFGTKGRRNQAWKVKFYLEYTFLSQSIVINKALLDRLSPT